MIVNSESALDQIQRLYQIERYCSDQEHDADDRRKQRIEKSLPILKALGKWMLDAYQQLLPKSPIGKALAYSIKRWDKLSAYAHSGLLYPDNNKMENSVRSVALGRKNYLFAGSHEAARRSAMLYSLIGTCKLHDSDSYGRLKDVLSKNSSSQISKIDLLLPHKMDTATKLTGRMSTSNMWLLGGIPTFAPWLYGNNITKAGSTPIELCCSFAENKIKQAPKCAPVSHPKIKLKLKHENCNSRCSQGRQNDIGRRTSRQPSWLYTRNRAILPIGSFRV